MVNWKVVVDVDDAEEVEAFSSWLERWRERVELSDDSGCGCCVHIWEIRGPVEAKAELAPSLIAFETPKPPV